MKFQFFGSRNVTTSEDLRAVGKSRAKSHTSEEWGLDAVSALRVPILGSRNNEPKLATFTVSSLVQSSPQKSTRQHLRLVESVKSESQKKVGIYSPCPQLSEALQNTIADLARDVMIFDSQSIQIELAAKMDTWLIHMLDEDDSPLLDAILELDASDSSLFLCERELSDQSIKKARDFLSGAVA